MRAIIYARVSTSTKDVLTEEGTKDYRQNPSIQIDAALSEIKKRNWNLICDPLIDRMSGRKSERPNYQNLMRLIETGQVDVIIFYRMSRLARSWKEWAYWLEVADNKKAELVCLMQPIDTTTPTGRFALKILAAADELFAEITQESIQDEIDRIKRTYQETGRIETKTGKYLGRPRKAHPEAVMALIRQGKSDLEISKVMVCSKDAIRKLRKKLSLVEVSEKSLEILKE